MVSLVLDMKQLLRRLASVVARRRIVINSVANASGFVASVAVAFFITPRLVHGLGDERYGVWALIESVLAYLSVLDLGVGPAVVRYVARFHETRESDELNRTLSASVCIFAVAGLVVLASTLAMAFGWQRPLGLPSDVASDARWLLVLLGLNLAVGLPLRVYAAALHGLGQYPIQNAIRVTILLVRSALVLAVLHFGGGLKGLGLVVLACGLLDYFAMAIAAWRLLPEMRFSWRYIDRRTLRRIGSYSGSAFVLMLADRVSFQTGSIVIGAFLVPQAVAYFAIAANMVRYARDGLRAVTLVLPPAISAMEARGDYAAIQRVLVDGGRWCVYMILPLQLGLWMLGRTFLANWMGEAYADECFPALFLLSAPLTVMMSQSVSARILYGVGRLHWLAALAVVESALNLVLSVILVRFWGIKGVAFASAAPSIVFAVPVACYACYVTRTPLRRYLLGTFGRPVLVALVPAAVWGGWLYVRGSSLGWAEMVAAGAAGIAAYVTVALIAEVGPAALLAQGTRALGRLENSPVTDSASS
jgi:O-antigen/teichoic acid export membrane protein